MGGRPWLEALKESSGRRDQERGKEQDVILADAPGDEPTKPTKASAPVAGTRATRANLAVGSDGRRFDARPSRYPGYTSLYDPVGDEWHDFPTKDCYPSIIELAKKKRRKGDVA